MKSEVRVVSNIEELQDALPGAGGEVPGSASRALVKVFPDGSVCSPRSSVLRPYRE